MTWTVLFHDAFDTEFSDMKEDLQDELLAHVRLLAEFGPNLGRPTVDTLKGSRHTNMKELHEGVALLVERPGLARIVSQEVV